MKDVSIKENLEEKEMKNKNDDTLEKEKSEQFKKAKKQPKQLKKQNKMTESEIENKKRKKVISIIAIGVVLVLAVVVSTIFAFLNIKNENIISGVSISGIDVSGLSKEEAKAKIENVYSEKKEKEISVKYQDYETTLNPTLMEVNYDVETAVNEANSIGRGDNIFINNYNILFTLIGKRNVNVNMSLNEDVTKQTISDISVNLPGVVIESNYSVEDDELIITKGKEGVVVNTEALLEKVKENLNDINSSEDDIEIPVTDKKPEEIDIDKIHDEVYREVQDAYYTKNPFAVYPEVTGIDFNVEEARKILEEDKEEYVIKLTITNPKVTISQIGSEAFPDKLASFTTRYDAGDTDRSTNLRIACQKINGKVVLAGETFSYNKALGARTAAAGYKNGKIYSAGEVVDGIGGGICQISSTLYNSVLMANLEIVERRNHQFVTSYVPAGRDATVVYGAIDFKFKNTRQYPIRIVASAQNGIATISIYGIKEENEYTFSFSTKTIASIPSTTQYIEDGTLPVGTEKVKQKGTNGLKTETYITKSLNGKVISTKLLSKDTYDAMTRIVLKGIKANSVTPNQNTESTTTPEQPANSTTPTETTEPTETTPSETTTEETTE